MKEAWRKLLSIGELTSLEVTVIVDDFIPEDAEPPPYPAHGLSMLIVGRQGRDEVRILFDGGPSPKLLEVNAESLSIDLGNLDLAFASIWLSHHVGGLVRLWLGGKVQLVCPPLPKGGTRRIAERGATIPGLNSPLRGRRAQVLAVKGPLFTEHALALYVKNRGWVAFFGCSLYGFRGFLSSLSNLRPLYGVIGGLNLSELDVLDLPYIINNLKLLGVKVLVPLHSVAPTARAILGDEFGFNPQALGAGYRVTINSK